MIYRTDNPIADFNSYEYDKERYLKTLPVCDYCGYRIQSEYMYDIEGKYICEECMNDHKMFTDDYITKIY